jgi:hypothetical protein
MGFLALGTFTALPSWLAACLCPDVFKWWGTLQANFACTTCSVCGMVYAQGEAADEKLHTTFHRNFLQGIRFQVITPDALLFFL